MNIVVGYAEKLRLSALRQSNHRARGMNKRASLTRISLGCWTRTRASRVLSDLSPTSLIPEQTFQLTGNLSYATS